MTTLKKASALFLSIILSNRHYLCYALDRILLVDINLDLYRFLTMDEKLRRFGDLTVRQYDPDSANSN
jgi:hypothetical protein